MNAILFGSLLNPLSATAAQYLKEQNILKLIVVAKSRCNSRAGFINILSQICIGFYRCIHVFLRAIRFKRSRNYISLLEFMITNPSIPKINFRQDSVDFERLLDYKLKDMGLNECLALSCVFPFKISVDLPQIKRFFNAHPGELPANRGHNPYFWVFANNMKVSGITYHILTPQIDEGNILFCETFPVDSDFSEYKLEKITSQHLKYSLPVFFERLEEFWANAKPQKDGVYYQEPQFSDRQKHRRRSVFHIRDFLCK